MTLDIGQPAPLFTLPTDGGGTLNLKDLQGKKVVIYFYPKDNTSGCTKQACAFKDLKPQFDKKNVQVVGVSKDSVKSHDKFVEKFDLNFPLASDESVEVCEAYGVWKEKSMYGRKYFGIERTTFLIDEKGVIQHIWPKVKVTGHVEAVLEACA